MMMLCMQRIIFGVFGSSKICIDKITWTYVRNLNELQIERFLIVRRMQAWCF